MAAHGGRVAPANRSGQRLHSTPPADVLDRAFDQRQQGARGFGLGPSDSPQHAHGLGYDHVEIVGGEHGSGVVHGPLAVRNHLGMGSQAAGQLGQLAPQRGGARIDRDGDAAERGRIAPRRK